MNADLKKLQSTLQSTFNKAFDTYNEDGYDITDICSDYDREQIAFLQGKQNAALETALAMDIHLNTTKTIGR